MGDEGSADCGDHGAPGEPSPPAPPLKGRSCTGCLYYSTALKSKGRNPRCFGLPRTVPQVPPHVVGKSEAEATETGRSLSDFKYACVGFSVFLDNKDNANEKGENQLPFCLGVEMLAERKAPASGHVPAHVHIKEDGVVHPQPRAQKPGHAAGAEFFSRFTRNAGLVASGVARNLNKVGSYVKDTFDDMMYPYRRRPK